VGKPGGEAGSLPLVGVVEPLFELEPAPEPLACEAELLPDAPDPPAPAHEHKYTASAISRQIVTSFEIMNPYQLAIK
jgi:hypothetical protein